jgi:biotin transporter BioY
MDIRIKILQMDQQVLSGGRGGIGAFAGPSAGFLFLYPFVAFFIGWVRDSNKKITTLNVPNFLPKMIPAKNIPIFCNTIGTGMH